MDGGDLRVDAILLVDSFSRLNAQIDISELRRFGVDIISDLKELLDMDYQKRPVIILEGFLRTPHGLSDMILHKQLLGLRYIFVGSDEITLRQVGSHAKCFSMDCSNVNYTLVSSVVNDDAEAKSLFQIEPTNKLHRMASVIAETNTFNSEMREVAQAYLRTSEEYRILTDSHKTTTGLLEAATSLNSNKDEQIRLMSEILDNILQQTVKVNQSLKDYSFLCSADVYTKVDLKPFKSRPNIIYFKEFNEFLCLKSFIFTLAEALKTQFSLPTKVLWVLDSKHMLRLRGIPEYYTVFGDGVFNKPEIHSSDYICTANGYETVIQSICENQVGLEILLIVDSKLADDTLVSMNDVLRYDLCRDHRKIKTYSLNDARTIVNGMGEERDLSWDYLPEYDDLDEGDRFLYFAGRPVIESLIRSARQEFGL